MSDRRPPTWGTTATLTDEAGRRTERMAYVGGVVLLLLALANIYGADLPGEAFLAALALFSASAAGISYIGGRGATAHAGQYQPGAHPAPNTVDAGPFSAAAIDPADRQQPDPAGVD